VFRIHYTYIILAVVLLLVEVLIATFVHDRIIRPYVGDFLVVMLIYCFIRGFFDIPVYTLALGVLLFAFSIEFLQAINVVGLLGLQDSKIARIIIGTSFNWLDLVAYTFGILVVVLLERFSINNKKRN